MQKFWELFEQSIITQALVTAVLVITVSVLYATGREVPADLYQLTILVVGFWFGSKTGFNAGVRKTAQKLGAQHGDD